MKKIYPALFKPALDKLMALLLLIFSVPVLLLSGILLLLFSGGKVLFFHERIGKDEKRFMLIKLRTMSDDEQVTGPGSLLRKLSIDELPQLFNVLKGDMSLTGPRPLLPEYLPYYTKEERERHSVRPGITGWAQVNGRNQADWGKRMELDRYYVNHLSLWLDLKILILTMIQFFKFSEADFTRQNQQTFIEYAKQR